ncbi:hypothetical protein VMCG_01210 [Cytospora schulzeri]|uniref:Extracellular membrane protein CFEM domain-containing protein n=1 Tax=Cytospora schulzeri TaxID=448051 RepID=A0A423X541_9PEZI|nr:hypothetical protein VMCG_01210 [Valsa malicola]
MRFTSFLVAGAFALLANAQTSAPASSSVSSVASVTTTDAAQSSEAACLKACDVGDVNCQAKCIAVPSPDAAQANATTQCVASCDQGNGTASENQAYQDCVQDCIDNNYFTSTGTPAQSTDASGSTASDSAASATGTSDDSSSASGTSGSSTASGTSSSSSSSASSSSSSSAEGSLKVGMAGVTLFGLIAAVFAL